MRFPAMALAVWALAAILVGCEATPKTSTSLPAAPTTRKAYASEAEAKLAQQLPERFDLLLSNGTWLRGMSFDGMEILSNKEYLHLKDPAGHSLIVRLEHVSTIR